jgi:UPF0176 protein
VYDVGGNHDTYSAPPCHTEPPADLKQRLKTLNIAAYRFVALQDLPALRTWLFDIAAAEDLRGTILVAPEGINLVLAGPAAGIAGLRRALAADDRLAALDFKESWSCVAPFRRLKVKVKDEIIALGLPDIDPARHPAPPLEPETLKSWLDEGREVILLDTRNAFEVAYGSFEGAVHLGNDTFRGFGLVSRSLPVTGRDTPVVTFCTGGIRCEKAAPLLLQNGHRNVFQLSGGILRYFERVGSAHYRGTCFVFDERIGLDPTLTPQKMEQL